MYLCLYIITTFIHSLHCSLLCVVHGTGFHNCVLTHTLHVKYHTMQFHRTNNPVSHLSLPLSSQTFNTHYLLTISSLVCPFPMVIKVFFWEEMRSVFFISNTCSWTTKDTICQGKKVALCWSTAHRFLPIHALLKSGCDVCRRC